MIGRQEPRQDFDGDVTVESGVVRAAHLTLYARTDELVDAIVAERRSRLERRLVEHSEQIIAESFRVAVGSEERVDVATALMVGAAGFARNASRLAPSRSQAA